MSSGTMRMFRMTNMRPDRSKETGGKSEICPDTNTSPGSLSHDSCISTLYIASVRIGVACSKEPISVLLFLGGVKLVFLTQIISCCYKIYSHSSLVYESDPDQLSCT